MDYVFSQLKRREWTELFNFVTFFNRVREIKIGEQTEKLKTKQKLMKQENNNSGQGRRS
jgi:hypothetical protein